MAKTTPKTPAVPATTAANSNVLARTGQEDLPDFLRDVHDASGTEDITMEDMTVPRIAIAQGLSPQIDPSNPAFIPGLVFTQMFNNLTGDIFGNGPIRFVIVRRDKPRWIEFIPRDQGGGVADLFVPPGDPRTIWRNVPDPANPTGKPLRLPPIATQFYDYVIVMLGEDDTITEDDAFNRVIALSMKVTQLEAAKALNSLIKSRVPGNKPIYSMIFELTSFTDKNKKGTFGNFKVRNGGTDEDKSKSWIQDRTTYGLLGAMFESLQKREVKFERDTTPVEGEEFPGAPASHDARTDDM